MSDCLFCKILKGDIPSDKVFENDTVYGFKDIDPMASEHYLFIHKKHSQNVNELISSSPEQLGNVFLAIKDFTSPRLERNGFRIVTNINGDGGQSVFHTHFHVLGGEALGSFGK